MLRASMPPKVLVLPKAVGSRVAQAMNANAEALEATIKQVTVLSTLTEPLQRPFLGRLRWLFLGR